MPVDWELEEKYYFLLLWCGLCPSGFEPLLVWRLWGRISGQFSIDIYQMNVRFSYS